MVSVIKILYIAYRVLIIITLQSLIMYVLMMITTALVNRMEELGKEILEHNGLEELYESASLAYPSVVGQHIHSYAHL